uniref:Angiopoietin 1 n=1 Tax=Tetraodon nigroviridis TaxID=99883 RepID=H3DK49_TETNG
KKRSTGGGQRLHRIQHGQCTYTFILPEGEGGRGASCREAKASGVQHNANSLQRDAPPPDADFPSQKIQQLEHIMENYTQWLQRIENYIKESMKMEMAQLQQNAVHNHTAAMLEMGTNLLSQTAEQTRKLTDVETQVLNQTSRLEIQLLENSLSTNKLEKELMIQTSEISKLHDKNSIRTSNDSLSCFIFHRDSLQSLETKRTALGSFYHHQAFDSNEDEKIYSLEYKETEMLHNKEQNFTSGNHSLAHSICEKAVNALLQKQRKENSNQSHDAQSGFLSLAHRGGEFAFLFQSLPKPHKVYCNMESAGGGWTVIQRREDGSVDFQRTWKEYKTGFGTVTAEHWLGNEYVYQLTSQRQYALRVELTDWEGHQAFSLYDRFQIGSEKQNYRLFLKSHSGTAGRQSSLVIHGADFSTKDIDNDNCMCKCALMLTGAGWWFDACGPSNLNGMYFTQGQHIGKLNGIKWHYFKGPSYSLRATAMMIRPLDF